MARAETGAFGLLRRGLAFVSMAVGLSACALFEPSTPAPVVLSGTLTHADHQTYRELPFTVPKGVGRITVSFTYDGKEQRTVVDLGLRDPNGQRGWSGGNKSTFTVGVNDATPSYLQGPMPAGEWRLVLGVPNIREGAVSHYSATISFARETKADRKVQPAIAMTTPKPGGPGWRRGDLHTHTAHSDGSCEETQGQRGPCPAIHTLEAASKAGLDFVVVSDHNTLSQVRDLAAASAGFPNLLIVPGEEITTFHGHANAIGLNTPVEFQLGSPRLPTLTPLLDAVNAQSAILSVNHPGLPSGEICMGCGWSVAETDWTRIASIEVVNGGSLKANREEGPMSGMRFWEKLLDEGYRITGVGGSDNHDATDLAGKSQSPVGRPATVVWSQALSTPAILAGIRSGHVYVDLADDPLHTLETEARYNDTVVAMGGVLDLPDTEQAILRVTATGVANQRIELRSGGLETMNPEITNAGVFIIRFSLKTGARNGWIRANVRSADGRLEMVGNPIYVQAR